MTDMQIAGGGSRCPDPPGQPDRWPPGPPSGSAGPAAAGLAEDGRCRVRIGSADGILAVIPHLLGFHPADSVVVLGIGGHPALIGLACRYDLPAADDPVLASEIAAHAAGALRRQRQETAAVAAAVVAGYGPADRVAPVSEALRAALPAAGIEVKDILRVQDGRYWSQLCQDPRCCPPGGTPFDPAAHPAAAALDVAGLPARPDRAALASSIEPLPGAAMDKAWDRALRRARKLIDAALPAPGDTEPPTRPAAGGTAAGRPAAGGAAPSRPAAGGAAPSRPAAGGAAPSRPAAGGAAPSRPAAGADPLILVAHSGRRAVRSAIRVYRNGGEISDADRLAWLGLTLTDLRVRDDAWARMDPEFRQAHQRLWTGLVRRLPAPFVAAPAALLAFTAWQSGDGALASVAIDRALKADPEYSMALLIGRALHAAVPPSAARPPLTPRQVAASYRRRRPGTGP